MAITLNGTTGITTPDIDSTTYGGTFSEDGTYLRMASGTGGIQFNGDTAAANALDDYEEGTWTPEVADATSGGNTGTVTVTYGTYVKVGKLVTIQAVLGNINTTGMTSTNVFYVRNFPFVSSSDNFSIGSCITDSITYQGGRTTVTCGIGQDDTWMSFSYSGSGLGDTNLDCGDITSGTGDIFFSIVYQAV